MKRLYTLIVLLALTVGALVTGCKNEGDQTAAPATGATNSTPSTNK